MTRRVIYLAHPLRPRRGESVAGNLASAERYLRALVRAGVTAVAPWILELRLGLGDDAVEEERRLREAALARCEAVAASCWAVAPVGSRWSAGMEREVESCGRHVRGLLGLSPEDAAEVVAAFVAGTPGGWS